MQTLTADKLAAFIRSFDAIVTRHNMECAHLPDRGPDYLQSQVVLTGQVVDVIVANPPYQPFN